MKAPPAADYVLYGLRWPAATHRADAIIHLIQRGGEFVQGETRVTVPLFTLYRDLQTELWPDDDHHEWSDLMLQSILAERITVIQGPKDCGKTHGMAKFALCDYFAFPNETLILMSSTDLRGLELRVWGDLKDLYVRARDRWHGVPGFPLDSLYGIFTDRLQEDTDVRDIRKGIICIPCLESSQVWSSGLVKYTGIKQKRRRLFGDEVQFMESPYLTALANINKGDFKGCFVGNPIGEGDPLDRLAEPLNGWDDLLEVTKTTTWRNKMGGITINLVGSDSPAIRHPGSFPYLINQKDIDYIGDYWGKESAEWWNQAMGCRRPGISLRKVITRDMVRLFGATDPVVWGVGELTRIYAVDAGYGGDRCIGGYAEFGKDINGQLVLSFIPPHVIPVRVYPASFPEDQRKLPEDQIADYVKAECEKYEIPAANVFHDATGRGSLGSAFARLWRHDTNPVEFGGRPTPRPVMADLLIYDEKLKQKRPKRCDEHYVKKVDELCFSVRYAIESRQVRNLPPDVLEELVVREWDKQKGDKYFVETKDDVKERLKRSPDKADWAAIIVEGARQRGFTIRKMSVQAPKVDGDDEWKDDFRRRALRARQSFALTTA